MPDSPPAPAPDPERPPPLLRLLGLVTARFTDELHAGLSEAGFDAQRPSDDSAMAHIPPEGIRLTDLADRAGVSKQAMAEVVSSLEARGYLIRRPDPTDGRARLIMFSERGWAAVDAALRTLDAIEARLADEIGPRRLEQLRRTLTMLVPPGG